MFQLGGQKLTLPYSDGVVTPSQPFSPKTQPAPSKESDRCLSTPGQASSGTSSDTTRDWAEDQWSRQGSASTGEPQPSSRTGALGSLGQLWDSTSSSGSSCSQGAAPSSSGPA